MRRISPVVVVLALAVSIAGCTSKHQLCEHARDRVELISVLDGKLVEGSTPEDQRPTISARTDQIAAMIREGFVAPCLELEGVEAECIVKLDSYAHSVIKAQRRLLNCRFSEGSAAECERWEQARREAEADYGEACVATVERIVSMSLNQPQVR
jgi:hypothetical protein